MNQLLRPKAPVPGIATSRVRPSLDREIDAPAAAEAVVEYDDGNPATISTGKGQPDTTRVVGRSAAMGAPSPSLATTPRAAAVDYDDGNPATINCG